MGGRSRPAVAERPRYVAVLQTMILRELRAVRRQVEGYPDDASPWIEVPGMPNTGGNLALHVAGNLRLFIGKYLGGIEFVRDRDAEFARRSGTREELLAGIDAATDAVERGLANASAEVLAGVYPERFGERRIATEMFLGHLVAHLAFHLGQLDGHRRVVTRNRAGAGSVALNELPDAG